MTLTRLLSAAPLALAIIVHSDGHRHDDVVTDLGDSVKICRAIGSETIPKAEYLHRFGLRNERGNLVSFHGVQGELTPDGRVVYPKTNACGPNLDGSSHEGLARSIVDHLRVDPALRRRVADLLAR